MNKNSPRTTRTGVRKTASPIVATKTGRRSSLAKSKDSSSISPIAKTAKIEKTAKATRGKARTGLASAAPRARGMVSRVKRSVAKAVSSR